MNLHSDTGKCEKKTLGPSKQHSDLVRIAYHCQPVLNQVRRNHEVAHEG